MPSESTQAMFVGSTGVDAFLHAARFWQRAKDALSSVGQPLSPSTRVLDVGVGWGRLYRWALRDLEPSQITGVDVDPSALEICREAMPYGDFQLVSPNGPCPEGYDLAILYSVFSHTSENATRTMLDAMRSALVPGGLIALTTLRPAHVDVWASQVDHPTFSKCLSRAKFDHARWSEASKADGYLYVPTSGGDETRPDDMYGEAVVSKGWWETSKGIGRSPIRSLSTCRRRSSFLNVSDERTVAVGRPCIRTTDGVGPDSERPREQSRGFFLGIVFDRLNVD